MSKQLCQSDEEEMDRVGEEVKDDLRRQVRKQFALLCIPNPILTAFKINYKKILIEEMKKFIEGDENVHRKD